MMGTVKQERHDDREINEMAKRIMEQNRQKAGNPAPGLPPAYGAPMQMARPGQPTISSYFNRGGAGANGGAATSNGAQAANGPAVEEKRIDDESRKGRFGWCEFEKNHIPYIFRSKGEKYTSVRMVERKLLNKFLSVLPHEVNSCHCIRSYYITDVESKLLNEINLKHTDCHFGKEPFTSKDLVVRLTDAKEFYRFLDLCYKKLVLKKSNATDRCGFFRINGESVVPYTMRANVKYVPLFYFEGETDHLKLRSDQVDGWDLAYLRFCCKVQGIRNELFSDDICRVVALEEIRGHFPQGTTFEDYWPAKGSIEPVQSQQGVPAGNWTQKPAVAASTPQAPAATSTQSRQQSSVNAYNQYGSSRNSVSSATAAAASAATAYQNIEAYNQLLLARNSAAFAQQHRAAQQQQQQQQQQLMRGYPDASTILAAQAAAAAAAGLANRAVAAQAIHRPQPEKTFPGKLTQIKEFPIERSAQPPYKLQKALIDQKIVPCINVRPFVFNDLMMTLPDFVRHFYPELSIEKARHMLQDILKVVLYKGNSGHQEILRAEGKCNQFDPAPLVLVKDIMNYMPQMKYMFNNSALASEPSNKRMRVS